MRNPSGMMAPFGRHKSSGAQAPSRFSARCCGSRLTRDEEIAALVAAIVERDAEIERLRERIRFLGFSPEKAAERIRDRAHPTLAPFKAEDGPRNNMGEPIMAREDFYAFMGRTGLRGRGDPAHLLPRPRLIRGDRDQARTRDQGRAAGYRHAQTDPEAMGVRQGQEP